MSAILIDSLQHLYVVGTASSVLVGLLLTAVILRSNAHNTDNTVPHIELAFILLALSLSVLSNALLHVVQAGAYPFSNRLPEPFQLLIGPAFYFYLCRLNCTSPPVRVKLYHLGPFFSVVIYCLLVLLAPAKLTSAYDSIFDTANWTAYLHLWVYYFLCRNELAKYRDRLKQSRSTIEKLSESWVNQTLFALLLGYTGMSVVYLLSHVSYSVPINKWLAVTFALVTYLIVYKTLRQPVVFYGNNYGETVGPSSVLLPTEKAGSKYQRSGLSHDVVAETYALVQQHMLSKKPFFEPELSLDSLAEQLSLSSHHLSQVINHGDSANFYDFINAYRIEEVKAQLSDPSTRSRSIISVAYDAGFNSKATFNRIFKSSTGLTPSQYRKLHSAKIEPARLNS